jgi:hypothetical protein
MAAARVHANGKASSTVCGGGAAEQSAKDGSNVVRSSSAVIAGCSVLLSASFQPRKGGDMACI